MEAAAAYMSDEENGLGFAYSGWAQCALPRKKLEPDARWEIATDRVRLVVEPGLRLASGSIDGPMEHVGMPFGAHAPDLSLERTRLQVRAGSRRDSRQRTACCNCWKASNYVAVGGTAAVHPPLSRRCRRIIISDA